MREKSGCFFVGTQCIGDGNVPKKSFIKMYDATVAPSGRLQMPNLLPFGAIFRALPFPAPP